ncbi:indole-3-glycerol phosphate synthase TrpC [Dyadobacter chenwenxiniae]|uniref:Indole-3-glycerol phosphate synthase n=1 Tax=Dyadobacter chenwenxiniae TaxID=2906456 RepID=A0A9X1TGM9_9BACT|nr:indole-3-glycerol phosphate synthase TrpC [Dyadobacter chenwenxiniae]MCF0065726.1 indole-3-glycerol phosphate synthase TrpC [Dyadobacter chenwenxiniae]UON82031.1 indole-3-glycerol phosphate synthase TrpC [Dyadobacter chenwenxiniae]
MNILDKIVARKREEVIEAKQNKSVSELEKEELFARKTVSLSAALRNASSPKIISEFKRKSPSKGIINANVSPEVVTFDYANAGAIALSVLTDIDFFGGSFSDFLKARNANPMIPMLRKDFIIDEYQLYEAKAIGADVILLIAACLTPAEVISLSQKAHELGLEVLLEVHNAEELAATIGEDIDIVGVNNRNLKTFETSIETSIALSEQIPDSFVKISESGLKDAETIHRLYGYGYKGFLIGETFMKTVNPGTALADLQIDLTQQSNLNPLVL